MELFDSMSVADNVALGREARLAGRRPLGHLCSPKHERNEIAEATASAIQQCGLRGVEGVPARELSTGQRRLVELARVLAGGFSMLLLDEPSSGLDRDETETFGATLLSLVHDRGIGVLLVEHDMGLVMSISDYVYVLDFGLIIFEGSALDAQQSTTVSDAYLGEPP
jgi:ABC-type branched-subunit amino acid transport system ATPase component